MQDKILPLNTVSTTELIEKNKDSKLTWTDSHCKPSESSNLLSAGTKQSNNSKYLKFSPKKKSQK